MRGSETVPNPIRIKSEYANRALNEKYFYTVTEIMNRIEQLDECVGEEVKNQVTENVEVVVELWSRLKIIVGQR